MTWLLLLVLAPAALALVVVSLREPMRVALPVFAALIPFGGALSLGPSRYGSASSLMGVVLAVGLVGQIVAGRRSAPRIPPSVPLWVLFLGIVVATTLWTVDLGATLGGIAVLSSLVAVYALAACSDVDRAVVRRVENGLMAGAAAAVGFGLFQLLFQGGFVGDVPGAGVEVDGRFGNGLLGPNIESVTLLVPLVVALHRASAAPRLAHRVLAGATAALMLVGILMTGSRTGTLAVPLVVLALLVSGPRRARRGLLVLLAVGLAVSVAVWVYKPLGVTDRTFGSATSSSGRFDIWEVGLAACSDYCASGSGWGTFPDVYAATQADVAGARVLSGAEGSYQPHNLWLLALIETGVLGALVFTAGVLVALGEALRLPREFRGKALGGLVGLMFGVLFLSSMEFKIFWLVLLMIALYGNVARAEAATAVAQKRLTRAGTPE
jgi:O-antigen ligase